MFPLLQQAREAVRSLVADIDVAALDAGGVTTVLAEVTAMEQSLAAVRYKLAKRGEETAAWVGTGKRSAAGWFADATGTSVGDAKRSIETADVLEKLPQVADVFEAGRLSETQVRQMSQAGEAAHGKQTELIDIAENEGFRQLRDRCREVKSAAESEIDERRRLRRMHRNRTAHWSVDETGAHVLRARFGPTQGPILKAHFDAEVDGIFRHATRTGRRETLDNYGTDAIFNLMGGRTVDGTTLDPAPDNAEQDNGSAKSARSARSARSAKSSDGVDGVDSDCDGEAVVEAPTRAGRQLRARAEIIFLVDYRSWRRGSTIEGETCEIAGLGPVPVALVEQFTHDAFLKAVVADGTDIKQVKHFARSIPAELKTALFVRDRGCAVPGCTNQLAIEVDHGNPYAEGNELSLDNGDQLCRPHHQDKTHNGHRLRGRPGKRRWTDQQGNVISSDRRTEPGPGSSERTAA